MVLNQGPQVLWSVKREIWKQLAALCLSVCIDKDFMQWPFKGIKLFQPNIHHAQQICPRFHYTFWMDMVSGRCISQFSASCTYIFNYFLSAVHSSSECPSHLYKFPFNITHWIHTFISAWNELWASISPKFYPPCVFSISANDTNQGGIIDLYFISLYSISYWIA